MDFWFVRHGESAHNAEGLFCGSINSPLTGAGFLQAEKAAEFFTGIWVDWVVTSPLQRAVVTAKAIESTTGMQAIVDPRLSEHAKGVLEGTPYRKMSSHEWDTVPGAETMQHLYRRVHDSLSDLVLLGGTGIIVSHAGVARAIQSIQQGTPAADLYNLNKVRNAEPYKVEISTIR